MDELEEAKEIMKKAGCGKAFAIYDLELHDLAEVRDCSENGESLEISKDFSELSPTIDKKLVFNPDKPIECPLNDSMDQYMEFSLKNRSISLCNLNPNLSKKIEEDINPLLKKYNWSIK
jgi:hypothetical protein